MTIRQPEAIRTLLVAHTPVSVEEATVEVDRYIGMPGQALAYKLVQRKILRLRQSARPRLGGRFDISGFDDAVLGSGAGGLPMLAELVGAWVASRSPNGSKPVAR